MSDADIEYENPPPERGLNWDRMMAVLAVVLSVTAILVSLFEVNSVRAHSKASVWPHLSVQTSSEPDRLALKVSNKGVGPALIRDITFLLDGQIVTDLEVAILDTLGTGRAVDSARYKVADLGNSVIAAGEAVDYLSLEISDETQPLLEAWSNKTDIELCYCSIQRDCWRTSLVSADTASVTSCAARGSALSVPSGLTVSEGDFGPITGREWSGTLRYLDFTSNEQTEIPVKAEVQSVTDRTIVYRLIFPEETQYNSVQRIRISPDGSRIDGQPIISRKRTSEGLFEIVTQGRSTDNSEPADIQVVYEIGASQFSISQRVRPDGEPDFFERNRYSFSR